LLEAIHPDPEPVQTEEETEAEEIELYIEYCAENSAPKISQTKSALKLNKHPLI
jgi:hypothetical protein